MGLGSAAAVVVDAYMVFGVAVPFVPQARTMLAARSTAGYNSLVSGVLMASATLRCFFWLGRHFDDVLLLQAFVVIATQIAMLSIITSINQRSGSGNGGSGGSGSRPPRRFTDFDSASFWAWDDLSSYLQAEAALVLLLIVAHGLFGRWPACVELLGTASLGLEAVLPMPQAWRNFKRQSTTGLSRLMVIAWLAGDVGKSIYAVYKDAPTQFVVCGLAQAAVDTLLLYQIYVLYPAPTAPPAAAALATRGHAVPIMDATSDAAASPPLDAAVSLRAADEEASHALLAPSDAVTLRHGPPAAAWSSV